MFTASKKKKLVVDESPNGINALLSELKQAQNELDAAYSNFDNAIDPDMIDYCIYNLNAVQKKHKYLLENVERHMA